MHELDIKCNAGGDNTELNRCCMGVEADVLNEVASFKGNVSLAG